LILIGPQFEGAIAVLLSGTQWAELSSSGPNRCMAYHDPALVQKVCKGGGHVTHQPGIFAAHLNFDAHEALAFHAVPIGRRGCLAHCGHVTLYFRKSNRKYGAAAQWINRWSVKPVAARETLFRETPDGKTISAGTRKNWIAKPQYTVSDVRTRCPAKRAISQLLPEPCLRQINPTLRSPDDRLASNVPATARFIGWNR
jgi:hypothetical protein